MIGWETLRCVGAFTQNSLAMSTSTMATIIKGDSHGALRVFCTNAGPGELTTVNGPGTIEVKMKAPVQFRELLGSCAASCASWLWPLRFCEYFCRGLMTVTKMAARFYILTLRTTQAQA